MYIKDSKIYVNVEVPFDSRLASILKLPRSEDHLSFNAQTFTKEVDDLVVFKLVQKLKTKNMETKAVDMFKGKMSTENKTSIETSEKKTMNYHRLGGGMVTKNVLNSLNHCVNQA